MYKKFNLYIYIIYIIYIYIYTFKTVFKNDKIKCSILTINEWSYIIKG